MQPGDTTFSAQHTTMGFRRIPSIIGCQYEFKEASGIVKIIAAYGPVKRDCQQGNTSLFDNDLKEVLIIGNTPHACRFNRNILVGTGRLRIGMQAQEQRHGELIIVVGLPCQPFQVKLTLTPSLIGLSPALQYEFSEGDERLLRKILFSDGPADIPVLTQGAQTIHIGSDRIGLSHNLVAKDIILPGQLLGCLLLGSKIRSQSINHVIPVLLHDIVYRKTSLHIHRPEPFPMVARMADVFFAISPAEYLLSYSRSNQSDIFQRIIFQIISIELSLEPFCTIHGYQSGKKPNGLIVSQPFNRGFYIALCSKNPADNPGQILFQYLIYRRRNLPLPDIPFAKVLQIITPFFGKSAQILRTDIRCLYRSHLFSSNGSFF